MASRRTLLALVALAACAVIGLVAVVDHSRKERAVQAANVSAWFCEHGHPERCEETKPATVEHAWNVRERIYQAGFGVGSAMLLGVVLIVVRDVRSRSARRRE
jgi:hypothetical protein